MQIQFHMQPLPSKPMLRSCPEAPFALHLGIGENPSNQGHFSSLPQALPLGCPRNRRLLKKCGFGKQKRCSRFAPKTRSDFPLQFLFRCMLTAVVQLREADRLAPEGRRAARVFWRCNLEAMGL
jgi:hypothetical protein